MSNSNVVGSLRELIKGVTGRCLSKIYWPIESMFKEYSGLFKRHARTLHLQPGLENSLITTSYRPHYRLPSLSWSLRSPVGFKPVQQRIPTPRKRHGHPIACHHGERCRPNCQIILVQYIRAVFGNATFLKLPNQQRVENLFLPDLRSRLAPCIRPAIKRWSHFVGQFGSAVNQYSVVWPCCQP